MKLIRLPSRFYDDHTERLGDEWLTAIRRCTSVTVVQPTEAGLKAILADAEFYANPRCMDAKDGCPQAVIDSARRTILTIIKCRGKQ